ncbi:unnamed protein product [Rotaria sordida]|uniref:TIR domain-containing protein n=1 Tax=Rotaria sordida TaxID=392033 RepID=A0A815PJS8_9BILA|nr:unnamed protein product [Rotaria sordida]
MIKTNVKFFNNPSFRSHLQNCLLNTHNTECQIQLLETQEIYLTLNGIKENVTAARQTIISLFEQTHTKIYDIENTDQQMIYWSNHITSDLIIPVIQQIMDHQNIFTLWEKTAMFCGYFKVVYFTHESFKVSEAYISEILDKEIVYVNNIVMPNEKTKNHLASIDQFIFNRQHPELAIIRCKYPYKLDIKISLFGRKNLVKKARKSLQSIINNHTIKTLQLKMNSNQHEYLLENCVEQLNDIENEYKNDCVKIRIRQKEFSVPQYLIGKIKQKIHELMIQTIICKYQKIGNSILLNDDNNKQFYQIAKRNYCRIEKIEIKTEMNVYSIPKALSQTSNISNSIIQQSNEFTSSLSMKKISVLNGSIEIYLTNQSISIPRDVTIISSEAGAAEEHINYMSDNGYFEMKSGRKFLFHRWSPIILNNDRSYQKFKKSIEKFISSCLQSITTCFNDVRTIAFITNEWENVGIQQEQLANNLINEAKQQIESRKIDWRILFMFNDQQINFYKEFYRILIKLQTDQDGFAQFSSLVSTIQIILAGSSKFDLNKCENEINNYVQKHILTNKILSNEFDIKQWDQHMINAFYKYCLNKSVLPNIDLITNSQIHLIGSMFNVEKAIEKYKLMSEILKLKSSVQIPPPIIPRTSIPTNSNRSNPVMKTYNIYFSYCQHDQTICNHITTCLIGEGYSICETPSNISLFQSYIDKSDVILVSFSENYSNNTYSITELNYAKSTKKKLIPFVIRNNIEESSWLASLILTELFYDLFDAEIDIDFKDDFDLEYDKLLSRLLHHKKPGITGKIYRETTVLPKITKSDIDYEEAAFGYQSIALQKVTSEQHFERERVYQQQLTTKLKNEKISNDDIVLLVASLETIVDDLEEILQGGNSDATLPTDEYDIYSRGQKNWKLDENSLSYIREFLNCIKRWLTRSPNVIQGNIAPFTPTGDINDAIFIIHQPSVRNFVPFDYSLSDKYFSLFNSNPGSCFNNEQSHDYLQKLIESNKPTNDMETMIEDNEIAWDTVSLFKANNDNDEDEIDNEWRTPEEIRKLEKLDNPNRIWKNTQNADKFIQQKIKNILEFKKLCEKSI